MPDIGERLEHIERRLDTMNMELGKIMGSMKTTTLLIKYVILPLIFITGALVGIKLVLP